MCNYREKHERGPSEPMANDEGFFGLVLGGGWYKNGMKFLIGSNWYIVSSILKLEIFED